MLLRNLKQATRVTGGEDCSAILKIWGKRKVECGMKRWSVRERGVVVDAVP
jgi:hypothetical protein